MRIGVPKEFFDKGLDPKVAEATRAAIKVYEKLETFDPAHRFFSWVYKIMLNECLNVLRARRPFAPALPFGKIGRKRPAGIGAGVAAHL